jgi:hypothetical protein
LRAGDEDLEETQIFFDITGRRPHGVNEQSGFGLIDGRLGPGLANESGERILRARQRTAGLIPQRKTGASHENHDEADYGHDFDQGEAATAVTEPQTEAAT